MVLHEAAEARDVTEGTSKLSKPSKPGTGETTVLQRQPAVEAACQGQQSYDTYEVRPLSNQKQTAESKHAPKAAVRG
jgi:hypothetical protein